MGEMLAVDAVNFFEATVGQDWLKEHLKLIKAGQGGGVAFGRGIETSLNVPAVAYYWYKAREEIAFSEITGENKCGSNSLLTAAIGRDLQLLKQAAGLPVLLQGLKGLAEPFLVLGQLSLASGYAGENYQITFKAGFATAAKAEKQINYVVISANGVNKKLTESLVANKQVIYIIVGDTGHEGKKRWADWSPPRPLSQMAAEHNLLLVVCGLWFEQINNRPVFIRTGRLVEGYNSNSPDSLVYIPNEKISINKAGALLIENK